MAQHANRAIALPGTLLRVSYQSVIGGISEFDASIDPTDLLRDQVAVADRY